MPALLAAKAVFLLHLAFLAFVVFGCLLVLWRPSMGWLHLPALAWGVWIVTSHGLCPLTTLEGQLLARAGAAGYDGGFIDHYLVPLLYPPGLTSRIQTGLGIALALWSLAIYGLAVRRWCRANPKPGS